MFKKELGRGVEIRDTNLHDIVYLKTRLRQEDVDEIYASNHFTPTDALTYSFYLSKTCLTIVNDNEPVGMFGIVEDPTDSNRALIWMLGSDRMNRVARHIIKDAKDFIEGFMDSYSEVYNHVDARNSKSIRWLEYLGAEIDDAVSYGREGLPFHRFQFKRRIIHAH